MSIKLVHNNILIIANINLYNILGFRGFHFSHYNNYNNFVCDNLLTCSFHAEHTVGGFSFINTKRLISQSDYYVLG